MSTFPTPPQITVYLQALGGKFLGPNAFNNSQIKVSFSINGKTYQLPYIVNPGPVDKTDDGGIGTLFSYGTSSFAPILQKPLNSWDPPTVYYLTPGPFTICGHTFFEMPPHPMPGVITAEIPSAVGPTQKFETTVFITPGNIVYRVVQIIPGLLLTSPQVNLLGYAAVKVTMMCGCKVTINQPTSYWTNTDFQVLAKLEYENDFPNTITLNFDEQSNDSVFIAKLPDNRTPKKITYSATQVSTGNFGSLEV